jgi:hypothetical protein
MDFLAALVLSYALSVGATSGAFIQYDNLSYNPIGSPLFADMEAELSLGPLFVGGSFRCDFNMRELASYEPFQNTYSVGGGLRLKASTSLTLELGYEHSCYHPFQSYGIVRYLMGETLAIPMSEGASDEVYLTLRGRVGGR